MENTSNKSRRNKLKYQKFIFSALYTIVGLTLFLLGKHLISGPSNWLLGATTNEKLFSFNLSLHWQIAIALNGFFSAYNYLYKKNDEGREKSEQLKFLVSKFLKLIIICSYGVYANWAAVRGSYFLIFLVAAVYFSVNCLLELLVELMNDHGVCNGFSLMFFADLVPLRWIIGSCSLVMQALLSWEEFRKAKFLPFLAIAILSVCFVKITNSRWEAPVETNKLYFANNKLLNDEHSKFGIRMNFGFMNIIQISFFMKLIVACYLALYAPQFAGLSIIQRFLNWFSTSNFQVDPNSLFQTFLFTNNSNDFFRHFWTFCRVPNFLLALFTSLFITYTLNWITVLYTQIKPREISEDLRKRGIYFAGVHPGSDTKSFIRRSANRLILVWTIFVIVTNFLFDTAFYQSTPNVRERSARPSFFNWFSGVNTGVELFRQIKTKYEYAKAYD